MAADLTLTLTLPLTLPLTLALTLALTLPLTLPLPQERDAMDAALSRVRDMSGSVQTRLAQVRVRVRGELDY